MFRRNKTPEPGEVAQDVAREIARRDWPAEAKPVTVRSALGDARHWSVIVPSRGVAVVGEDLRVVVASSNRPLAAAPTFSHTNVEATAEQILRNLPLP